MAIQKATVSFIDAHQDPSTTNFYVNGAVNAATAVMHLKALTNAKINDAFVSSPIDISALVGNVATNDNIETIYARAVAHYTAPGGTGNPDQEVLLKIPAPHGDLVGPTIDLAAWAPLQALVGKITAADGTPTNFFHGVTYER